ncbi:hypothetical protein GP486_005903 [Trichoglossum hirsutum]|uniref:Mtf2-like C-terminal domain-containing protein n=1 Tax=Trichoglossum hirsutum TaxID=265104 RepID=A0A9P8L8C9_9PEZI|nr:hypothetical protein GP486_005903 [Trichoglossum hirsutum]
MRLLSRSQLQSASLLPFLYETVSLQQHSISTTAFQLLFGRGKQCVGGWHSLAFSKSPSLQRPNDAQRWETEDRPDGEDSLVDPKEGRSTITDSEQATFNRIFREIMANTNPSVKRPQRPLGGTDEGWTPMTKERQLSAKPQDYSDLDDIIASAVATAGSGVTAEQGGKMHRLEVEAVSRYPAALRAAAARASGLINIGQAGQQQVGQHPDEDGTSEVMDEAKLKEFEQLQRNHRVVEAHRLAELVRVESRLRAAKTDFELWTVLEKEVFSLAKRVERNARKMKSSSKQLKDDIPELPQDLGQNIPVLAVAGPNYPHTLLLAMRLLKHDFRAPALCLTLFQHVKALGSSSYVLGASTALYNEVLDVKWRQYHDLAGVVELLVEMQKNGVEFNDETEGVLAAIHRESGQVMAGLRGEGMKVIWRTPAMKGALAEIRRVKAQIRRAREEERSAQLSA